MEGDLDVRETSGLREGSRDRVFSGDEAGVDSALVPWDAEVVVGEADVVVCDAEVVDCDADEVGVG